MIKDKDSFVFGIAVALLDKFQEYSKELKKAEPKDLVDSIFHQLLPKALKEEFKDKDGFPPGDFKEAVWDFQYSEVRTSLQPANGNYTRAIFEQQAEDYRIKLELPQANRLSVTVVLAKKYEAKAIEVALAEKIYFDLINTFLSEISIRTKMKAACYLSDVKDCLHFKKTISETEIASELEKMSEADWSASVPRRTFNFLLTFVERNDVRAFCLLNSAAAKKFTYLNQLLVAKAHKFHFSKALKSKYLEYIIRLAKPWSFEGDDSNVDLGEVDGPGYQENEIYFGPPGTGKTFLANGKHLTWNRTSIQFHPSYSYEHFVQGERLVTLGNERTTQIVDGPLMIAYRRATNAFYTSKCLVRVSPDNVDQLILTFPAGIFSKYGIYTAEDLEVSFDLSEAPTDYMSVLSLMGDSLKITKESANHRIAFADCEIIEVQFRSLKWSEKKPELILIDEINRADSARVFGELMNALAEVESPEPKAIRLQYSGEKFKWPTNMKIIATMNSADRSIGEIDQAMKRRFRIVEVPPDPILLGKNLGDQHLKDFKLQMDHRLDKKRGQKEFGKFFDEAAHSNDSLFRFYNKVIVEKINDRNMLLPIPGPSLKNLHNALLGRQDIIFALKRKQVGHSFHMDICKKISNAILESLVSDFPFEATAVTELAHTVKGIYDEFIKQDIKPQIESICLDNERLVEQVMTAWKTLDDDTLKEEFPLKDERLKKAAGEQQ